MTRVDWLGAHAFYGEDGDFKPTARAFLQEVFLENVEVQPTGCWYFLDSWPNVDQYRRFGWRGKSTVVHRFAYALFKGAIPKGKWVLHSCDHRPCCNPKHLRIGTAKDNSRDTWERGQHPGNGFKNKTHCPQGHPYDDSNTKWYHGRRYCRACHTVYSREWARRNKEHTREKLRGWRARQKLATT